jgi:hypothetical protein
MRQWEKIQELLRPRCVICRGSRRGERLLMGSAFDTNRRYNFGAKSSEFVCRNLEFVGVGVAEVDRVCDFVVLEFKLDAAAF